jgi:hypothetical protein
MEACVPLVALFGFGVGKCGLSVMIGVGRPNTEAGLVWLRSSYFHAEDPRCLRRTDLQQNRDTVGGWVRHGTLTV